jgi:hypothetical protein
MICCPDGICCWAAAGASAAAGGGRRLLLQALHELLCVSTTLTAPLHLSLHTINTLEGC